MNAEYWQSNRLVQTNPQGYLGINFQIGYEYLLFLHPKENRTYAQSVTQPVLPIITVKVNN